MIYMLTNFPKDHIGLSPGCVLYYRITEQYFCVHNILALSHYKDLSQYKRFYKKQARIHIRDLPQSVRLIDLTPSCSKQDLYNVRHTTTEAIKYLLEVEGTLGMDLLKVSTYKDIIGHPVEKGNFVLYRQFDRPTMIGKVLETSNTRIGITDITDLRRFISFNIPRGDERSRLSIFYSSLLPKINYSFDLSHEYAFILVMAEDDLTDI